MKTHSSHRIMTLVPPGAEPQRRSLLFSPGGFLCCFHLEAFSVVFTWRWTTHACTATNASLKILREKASVGMSNGYCCTPGYRHKSDPVIGTNPMAPASSPPRYRHKAASFVSTCQRVRECTLQILQINVKCAYT